MLVIDWKKQKKGGDNIVSLRYEINKNSKILKKKYYDLINRISLHKYKNENIKKISNLEDNFDLWNSSAINEKSFYNSSEINDIILLFCLEKIINNSKHKVIKIINFDIHKQKLISTLKKKYRFSKAFIIENDKYNTNRYSNHRLKSIYYLLPFCLRGIIQILKKIRFIFLKNNIDFLINDNCVHDVYFTTTYYLQVSNKIDKLENRLVGNIPKKFSKNKKRIFLCNYHNSKKSIFNTNLDFKNKSNLHNKFILIDSLFSYSDLFLLIKIYSNIFIWKKFKKFENNCFQKKDLSYLWPFLKESWMDSFYGPTSIKNIYYFILLRKIIKKLKNNSRKLFYIYENQGWDKILLDLWTREINNETYGIINSSIRFWDFRYEPLENLKLKRPKNILINRNFMKKKFNKKFNIKKINNIFDIKKKKLKYSDFVKNRIVVFGDIQDNVNYLFLNEINNNFHYFKNKIFYFKKHPASKINLDYFKNVSFINFKSKNFFVLRAPKAITLGATSTIIEIKNFFKKTSVYIPPSYLDFSPGFVEKKIEKLYSYEDIVKFVNH